MGIKGILFVILWTLALATVAGWIWLRRFERAQLYVPSADIQATPAQYQSLFQEVQFVSADDTPLFGWWIPANRPRGTVV